MADMKDHFFPLPLHRLFCMIMHDLEKGSYMGIPREVFYSNGNNHLQIRHLGQLLDTPVGPAAGPHTQLAHNIVGAWLCGARYIELKTVQTLDELTVPKPCIDMQDEGYNCEWSQELKMHQSFDQYLDAWIIIHLLGKHLHLSTAGTIFNMSVGYNLEGILNPNVQWFFEKMNDCSAELQQKTDLLAIDYPWIREVNIPKRISDNITLSTMHGCPPDEIEKIGMYLINQRGLHTIIKLNPTLLGPHKVRNILNQNLCYKTPIPDQAFEHDLKYTDAVNIIRNLKNAARDKGVCFGLKLTNTLESNNFRNVFKNEKQMYMSGKALHPLAVNLAAMIRTDFPEMEISFSAGADCFNISDLIGCNLKPVTVSTDLLKPGGYGRLGQYLQNLTRTLFEKNFRHLYELAGDDPEGKLIRYSAEVAESPVYKKTVPAPTIKTPRPLSFFDCIHAPCQSTCPGHQEIPHYMHLATHQKWQEAFEVILRTNPFPSVTGGVCDHECQTRCTRVHYDQALAIREIKRFISSFEHDESFIRALPENGHKAVVIGAGPAGLSCAWYLRLAGFKVTVYEEKPFAGGMVQHVIPSFRLPDDAIENDINRIRAIGVDIQFNRRVDKELFKNLHASGAYIFAAIGAGLSYRLNIPGEDHPDVADPLEFLASFKKGKKYITETARYIIVIGGGNTAMDVARQARKAAGENSNVVIAYRRTIHDMPASHEEIIAAQAEGVQIKELLAPLEVFVRKDKVKGMRFIRMKVTGVDNNGRSLVAPIPGSDFEVQADLVIPAVGQYTQWPFSEKELMKPAADGMSTSLERVYVGGDARAGASNIIHAIADGRKAAQAIVTRAGLKPVSPNQQISKAPARELMIRKMSRTQSEIISYNGQKAIESAKQAAQEARRCLLCDEICNICVTVCPNFANQSYQTEPVSFSLQKATRKNGKIIISDDKIFKINQPYQIFNVAEFCNECGNCRTFCPTADAPYTHKPRVHFTEASWKAEKAGYYWQKNDDRAILQFTEPAGQVHELWADSTRSLHYHNAVIEAVLDEKNLKIRSIKFTHAATGHAAFEQAAIMKILYDALNSRF
jgi:putative selenate reductase